MKIRKPVGVFAAVLSGLLLWSADARAASNCQVTKTENTGSTIAQRVKLHTDEGCWVGATGKWRRLVAGEVVRDEDAQYFKPGDHEFWVHFRCPENGASLVGYQIKLWSKRVNKADCRSGFLGLGPCDYCNKYGYHLEGWLWTFTSGNTSGI